MGFVQIVEEYHILLLEQNKEGFMDVGCLRYFQTSLYTPHCL